MPALKKKGASADIQGKERRVNQKKDQMINDRISENPDEHKALQNRPKEELVRLVLLQRAEQQQRIDDYYMKEIEKNPQQKAALEGLAKGLPEGERKKAMINGFKAFRDSSNKNDQTNSQKQESSGVKV